jgi:hypothetical protein
MHATREIRSSVGELTPSVDASVVDHSYAISPTGLLCLERGCSRWPESSQGGDRLKRLIGPLDAKYTSRAQNSD